MQVPPPLAAAGLAVPMCSGRAACLSAGAADKSKQIGSSPAQGGRVGRQVEVRTHVVAMVPNFRGCERQTQRAGVGKRSARAPELTHTCMCAGALQT